MKVYLIAHHDEHGADDMVGTLEKDKVETIFEKYLIDQRYSGKETDTQKWKDYYAEEIRYSRARLKDLITTDVTGKYDLMNGWGGPQLYIIELT